MKKKLFLILTVCIIAVRSYAQPIDGMLCLNSNYLGFNEYRVIDYDDIARPQKKTVRNQSFFRHIDLELGNIFSLAAFSLAGGLLNMAVSDKLCREAFLITPISAKSNTIDLDVENYKWNHIDANDLFKDIQIGGNLCYQSQRGVFNAGMFASLHYRINQFKVEDKNQNSMLKHNVHRIIPGINTIFSFGDLTSARIRTYIEAGIRYAIAVNYSNPYNLETNDLNNGFISHFAVYVAPNPDFFLQDIGLFIDINHYNLAKSDKISSTISDMKMWTLGIQFSISRGQAEERTKY